jgi:hypothetical protein
MERKSRGAQIIPMKRTRPRRVFLFYFFSWDPTAAARPIHNFSIGKKYDRQKNSYQQWARTYHGVIDRLPQTNDFFTPTGDAYGGSGGFAPDARTTLASSADTLTDHHNATKYLGSCNNATTDFT